MAIHDIGNHLNHLVIHIGMRVSHSGCPECRADNQRWLAQSKPHIHLAVPKKAQHEYLEWIRPRLEAIRNGAIEQERMRGDYNALWWHRNFIAALHNRISSHMAETGRKYVKDYAKDRMAYDGTDWKFIHER